MRPENVENAPAPGAKAGAGPAGAGSPAGSPEAGAPIGGMSPELSARAGERRSWAGDFRGIVFADGVAEPTIETLGYYPTYRWGTLRIFCLKVPKGAKVWKTWKEWYERSGAVTKHIEYLIVCGTKTWRYTLSLGDAEMPDVLYEGEDVLKHPDFAYTIEVGADG